jgi:putative hydrolase of the HAD superfamily
VSRIPAPKAVLFDLFHTLVSVPAPATVGLTHAAELLGVPMDEWQRRYHDDDEQGRCVGRVTDHAEAVRLVAHSIDPAVTEDRIRAAVESRRRCFEIGLVDVAPDVLRALDRLRAASVRLALVSDAGADDVESWPRSPLRERLDAVVFSYQLGVRKPDARMYREALAALGPGGIAPDDAIFVGDGGSDEHRGARALGIRTVLVTRLISHWPPDVLDARRSYVDWEFADVAAFIDALEL